jgi:anti-sigma-K factor RskA
MEESKMKELMIDYLDGNLTGELNDFVKKHIEKDGQWKAEFEKLKVLTNLMDNSRDLTPDPSLQAGFDKMLAEQMALATVKPEAKTVYWNNPKMWMQIAASVTILVAGVLVGTRLTSSTQQDEMIALRKEMEATKHLVLTSLHNQSASSRIGAVNASYQMSSMDDEIVEALINAMNTDQNANVRLAALDALSEFADEEPIRKALIKSLTTQDKAVVQIALINLMVQLKENRAIAPMKKIIDDENSIEVVKDEANYGVFKLS